MSTAELKEMLADRGIDDAEANDWKRLSKRSGYDGLDMRVFENKKTGYLVWTFGDADDEFWHPGGDQLFSLLEDEDQNLNLSICPKSYWDTDHCLWDQHASGVLNQAFKIPDWISIDETSENCMMVELADGYTIDDARNALINAGLVHSPELDDFLKQYL